MLPVRSRVRTRAEHALVVQKGRRVAQGPLVLYVLRTPGAGPPRAGFIVGRAIGPAVLRNRVRRRLREQVSARLDRLQPGVLVVVRAAPDSSDATSAELAAALDAALEMALRPGSGPPRDTTPARARVQR